MSKYTTPGVYRCPTSAIRAIEDRMVNGEELQWMDELTDEQAVAAAWVNDGLKSAANGDEEVALSLFIALIDQDITFVAEVADVGGTAVVTVSFQENNTQEVENNG